VAPDNCRTHEIVSNNRRTLLTVLICGLFAQKCIHSYLKDDNAELQEAAADHFDEAFATKYNKHEKEAAENYY
jgi:hypothetical protein